MQTNTYSVESIFKGVGWLKVAEERTIREILGDGTSVDLDQDTEQLHLCWSLNADGMDEAIEFGRRILRIAGAATGVFTPHPSFFSIREIAE